MKRICFVALHAYPLFRPSAGGVFGGTEIRAWLFARALARKEALAVSMVVLDHGQPDVEIIDRVRIFRHLGYSASVAAVREPFAARALRAVSRRMRSLIPAGLEVGDFRVPRRRLDIYRRVDADVYCVFGVSNLAAEVVAFCRSAGKASAIFAGSDEDFSAEYQARSRNVNVYGSTAGQCRYALDNSDLIITQSDAQAGMASERFGREAVTVRNPVDLSSDSPAGSTPTVESKAALWIGKSDRVKRPDLLIELARSLPEIRFMLVMNRADSLVFDKISGALPPNVELIENVPFAASESLFRRAFALVNTSRFEGFPNTFLQAGKHEVPIASLEVDPDGFLQRERCGIVAQGSLIELARGLKRLHSDADLRMEFAHRLRSHVERNHRLEDRAPELEAALQRACALAEQRRRHG